VLRGGAWNNNQNNARCDARNRNNPNNSNDNIGFRVCAPRTWRPARNVARHQPGGRGPIKDRPGRSLARQLNTGGANIEKTCAFR
jgi:hypothetical protein